MKASSHIVIGVDVGGEKKGFHVVALCGGQVIDKVCMSKAEEVAAWCRGHGASAVGIDAPCSWSETGRARHCERELAKKRIFTFATPTREKGEQHPFYRWMCKGMQLYELLAPHYARFGGSERQSSSICFETFPHAVACALAGGILLAKQKRTDRPRLLRAEGVFFDSPDDIDMVDAALCALTANRLLADKCKSYGDAREGFIIVPDGLPA